MELRITEYAIAHLVESVEVTLHQASPDKRGEVVDQVLRELEQLARWPRGGQVEPWLAGADHEYRRWVIGHFKVIYRIEKDTILITDIFDSRQDPRRMKR